MTPIQPRFPNSSARVVACLACLGFGLAGDTRAIAQGYDRIIRPGDIEITPLGQQGLHRIRFAPSVINGTEGELDMSMELTVYVNGQSINTEALPAIASGGGQTCNGSCPGACSGPSSECVSLVPIVGQGCTCSVVVTPAQIEWPLSPGDLIACELFAAEGSVTEAHVENDYAEITFGAPAATVISAVSRRTNPVTRAICDTDMHTVPPRKAEPHMGGIQEIRIGFDAVPAGLGSGWTLEEATCAAPNFVPYAGASASLGRVINNELVITFTPGLENARSYRIHLGPAITSVQGQSVEARGLVGDLNHDGFVNALDRSMVVGAWTGGSPSCASDVSNDGVTNATDRSIVVGAWTGGTNCAP